MSHMPVNPCLSCGACCAYYRASFYWAEAEDNGAGGIPPDMTEKLNDFRLVMKGTSSIPPRCIALSGFIGLGVACSIYDRRPSICRELEPSWQNNAPNPACDKARLAWGHEPLTPESWSGGHNLPKAA